MIINRYGCRLFTTGDLWLCCGGTVRVGRLGACEGKKTLDWSAGHSHEASKQTLRNSAEIHVCASPVRLTRVINERQS